jgi:outer membrane autotransporter protein
MVQTANDLPGNSGLTFLSLELDSEQLNSLVQDIAHDDKTAVAPGAVQKGAGQMVVNNVSQRLVSLRAGETGLNIAGLAFKYEGVRYAATEPGQLLEDSAAGDDEAPRWGAFANGIFEFGDLDGSAEEAGFDFHSEGLTAGADYRVADGMSLGLAMGFAKETVDYDRNRSDLDDEQLNVSIYGTYYQNESWYVDGILGYTHHWLDGHRDIRFPGDRRTADGDTDGDELLVAAGGGYVMTLGGGFDFGPYARLEYKKLWIDSFKEKGAFGLNLSYEDDDLDSVISNLGLNGSFALSTDVAVVTTSLYMDWEHEYRDDRRNVRARYTADPNTNTGWKVRTDSPDRDSANLGGSVSAMFQGGIAIYANYETLLFYKRVDRHEITAGFRVEL